MCSRIKKYRFLFDNSEEELLKVVARSEKLEKEEIESKKDYNNRIQKKKLTN